MAKIPKCRICKSEFTKRSMSHVCCSVECAITHTRAQDSKKFNAITKQKREKLKTAKDFKKDLQVVFNRFIRLRDADQPCISCQRYHSGQYHAGHYKGVGSTGELRFEELNVHKQCAPCNNHLSANLINYRVNLISKIGVDKVEWLEGPHKAKKYTIEKLKDLIKHYKSKCKELEQDLAA